MKLSSNVDSLYRKDRDGYFATMREIGYDAIDYGVFCDKLQPGKALFEADATGFEKYFTYDRKLAEAAGIEIGQTHAPFPTYYDDPQMLNNMVEALKKSIIATRILGSDYIVMHAAMPTWSDDYDRKEYRNINYSFFEKIIPVAQEYNVKIALENMPAVKFKPNEQAPVSSQIETIIEYVDMMKSDNFVACLDTGHANCAGVSPADFARALGDRLHVLHIHDNFNWYDEHTLPFTGTVNWEDFAKALVEIGYKGNLNLEWRTGLFPDDYVIEAEKFAFKTLKRLKKMICE